jgi:hypothetical protein
MRLTGILAPSRSGVVGTVAQQLDKLDPLTVRNLTAAAKGFRPGDNPARWDGHLKHLLAPPEKLSRGRHAAMANIGPTTIAACRNADGSSSFDGAAFRPCSSQTVRRLDSPPSTRRRRLSVDWRTGEPAQPDEDHGVARQRSPIEGHAARRGRAVGATGFLTRVGGS